MYDLYVYIVLKMCRLSSFCVFYIAFYNIQNYVKSPLKMQEMAFQSVDLKIFRGRITPDPHTNLSRLRRWCPFRGPAPAASATIRRP